MAASPSKEAYRRLLVQKILNKRMWILASRNKPPEPENVSAAPLRIQFVLPARPVKQRRYIPHVWTYL
jgi:cell division cycle protein 20 (cofactor of APC complex)